MAYTIQQLQDFSNSKPELRWITEQIIDYLEANPSSPGGGGVQSVTGDVVDNSDPTNPIINVPPSVQSISGDGVDNSDPQNPIISASGVQTFQDLITSETVTLDQDIVADLAAGKFLDIGGDTEINWHVGDAQMSVNSIDGGIAQLTASSRNGIIINEGDNTAILKLNGDGGNYIARINKDHNFADDAAAATGGVPIGTLYHTNGAVKIRLV